MDEPIHQPSAITYRTPNPPVVQYWAISILNSKTFWVGVGTTLLGLLSDPELRALAAPLVPLSSLPRVMTVLGIVMVILRKLTKRPVVMAAHGTTHPVLVPRLGPPDPPVLGD